MNVKACFMHLQQFLHEQYSCHSFFMMLNYEFRAALYVILRQIFTFLIPL